jgi:hypothetical protein
MKKNLYLLLLIIFINEGYSQKIKFVDLKYIYEHNMEPVDDFLLKKGFEFHERETKTSDPYPTNIYKGKNQTFIVKYSDESRSGFSWYQFYDSKTYTSIREECKKYGFKLLRTNTDELKGSGLTYIYTDGERKIEFKSQNENNKTLYFVTYGDVFKHELLDTEK